MIGFVFFSWPVYVLISHFTPTNFCLASDQRYSITSSQLSMWRPFRFQCRSTSDSTSPSSYPSESPNHVYLSMSLSVRSILIDSNTHQYIPVVAPLLALAVTLILVARGSLLQQDINRIHYASNIFALVLSSMILLNASSLRRVTHIPADQVGADSR